MTGKSMRGRLACLAVACALLACPAATAEPDGCRGSAMPGLTAAWSRFAAARESARRSAQSRSADVTAVVGAYEEFARVALAILGSGAAEPTGDTLAAIERDLASGRRLSASCDPQATLRDQAAWRMLSAGYSASEIEDVLTGRLQRAEIDHARRLLMTGYGRRAADYLEAAAARHGPRTPARTPPALSPLPFGNAPVLANARASEPPATGLTAPSSAERPRVAATIDDAQDAADLVAGIAASAAAIPDEVAALRLPLGRTPPPRDLDLASILGTPDASRLGELPDPPPTSASTRPASGLTAPKTVAVTRTGSGAPEALPATPPAAPIDPTLRATIHRYATFYGVDPSLVHAMVDAESRGDHRAVSARGARGLMQLMPGTARMLGVNPHDPLDNLRGGIQYLAGLVRQFGDVSSALIAYNAGPTHAERVRRGEAVLYGETRRYLERIAGLTGVASYLPGR